MGANWNCVSIGTVIVSLSLLRGFYHNTLHTSNSHTFIYNSWRATIRIVRWALIRNVDGRQLELYKDLHRYKHWNRWRTYIINPRPAYAARVTVVGSVCVSVSLSVTLHLTSRVFVGPTKYTTYLTGNDG